MKLLSTLALTALLTGPAAFAASDTMTPAPTAQSPATIQVAASPKSATASASSKACVQKADAKYLHGKARDSFLSECEAKHKN